MRILITTDQNSLLVSKVYLEEGYIPNVAGYTLSSGIEKTSDEKSTEYLEPAIWFKVEQVDTLCIDCRLRMIYWTERRVGEEVKSVMERENEIDTETDRIDECKELQRHGNILEEGCVDFVNNLEEVYDSMQLLCTLHKRNRVSSLELCKALTRLLHVNILPLVKLNSSHLKVLQQSMMQQEKYLNHLNDIILMMTIQLHEIKNSKKRNRKNIRHTINSSDLKFQEGLVELLEYEFNLDLEHNVNQYKEMMSEMDGWEDSTSGSVDDFGKLKIRMHETKAEILSLNKVLERMSNTRKRGGWFRYFISQLPLGDDAQLQKIYLHMDVKGKEIQKEIYSMMDKKLMVSSVMETMRGVSNELRDGNESYGLEIEKKSRMQMSDILSNSFATRSFKSLPDQISVILNDLSHILTTSHLRTELEVRKLITSTLIDCKQQKLYNSLVSQLKFKPHDSFTVFYRSNSEGNRQCSSDNSLNILNRICDLDSSLDDLNDHTNHKFKSLPDIAEFNSSTIPRFIGLQNSTNVPTFCSYIENPKNFFEPEYNFSYVTETIDQLKEEIPIHFVSICSDIQLEIDKSYNELNYRKVWVIYENYFFEHILDLLIELYMTEYDSKVKVFVERICHLTLHDLDLVSSNITKLLILGHHSKKADLLSENGIQSSKIHSSSVNSEKTILDNFGNFFNSTEEINKERKEVSSSSDFSDSFESDDAEAIKMSFYKTQSSTSNDLTIAESNGLKEPLMVFNHAPLPSFSSSELLCLDAGEDLESNFKSVKLQPCILDRFSKAYGYLRQVLVAKTLMKKTHYLSNCLKEVSRQLERLSREVTGKSLVACNDDLMDTIIILLCNTTEPSLLAGIYVQVKLLTDYLASFFEYGEFKFTLTLFLGVCNHLQDKIFMKNYKESQIYKASLST